MNSSDELDDLKSPPPPAVTKPSARGSQAASGAGPSSKPASQAKKNGRNVPKVKKKNSEEFTAAQDITVIEDSDSEDIEKSQATTQKAATSKGKPPPKRGTRVAAKPATGKNKPDARALPDSTGPDPLEENASDIELMPENSPIQKSTTRNSRQVKPSKPPNSESVDVLKELQGLRKEVERLRSQLAETESQRDKVIGQLDELFRIRRTEPEEELIQRTAEFETRLETQQSLIEEQSKLIAAAGSTKSYMLHFLSRDAADEEKKEIEQELVRSKDVVKQKDALLVGKDRRIDELLKEKRMVEAELKAEVERSKSLVNRNPPPTIAPGAMKGGSMSEISDPKLSAVFTLYEDLTNFLVLKAQLKESPFTGFDEKIYDCIYSAPAGTASSLHFTLRLHYIKLEDADPTLPLSKQLLTKIEYTPLDLEKEGPEFIEELDFIGGSFTFPYEQLYIFLRTLWRILGPGLSEPDNADDDDMNTS